MTQWLDVRHGVAHGHAVLPIVNVLQGVRDRTTAEALPASNVRLSDAIDCMRFFRAVVKVTADAAASRRVALQGADGAGVGPREAVTRGAGRRVPTSAARWVRCRRRCAA